MGFVKAPIVITVRLVLTHHCWWPAIFDRPTVPFCEPIFSGWYGFLHIPEVSHFSKKSEIHRFQNVLDVMMYCKTSWVAKKCLIIAIFVVLEMPNCSVMINAYWFPIGDLWNGPFGSVDHAHLIPKLGLALPGIALWLNLRVSDVLVSIEGFDEYQQDR